MNPPVAAAANVGTIYGVGYREIEHEVDPDDDLSSTKENGVTQASFAGGTAIFLRADDLAHYPEANRIVLFSKELQRSIPAPPLSTDDSFNSNTAQGLLAYRLPAVRELLGVPQRVIDSYLTLTFTLSVETQTADGKTKTLQCEKYLK